MLTVSLMIVKGGQLERMNVVTNNILTIRSFVERQYGCKVINLRIL